jgi:hypothetical protein
LYVVLGNAANRSVHKRKLHFGSLELSQALGYSF